MRILFRIASLLKEINLTLKKISDNLESQNKAKTVNIISDKTNVLTKED